MFKDKSEFDEIESSYRVARPYLFRWFAVALLIVVGLSVLFGTIGLVGGFFSSGAKVVENEFYPEAMLRKYEWFKDAAAQLDKKRADIQVYAARLKDATTVDRTEREQRMIWLTELAGIKASYNATAAEYNSQMVKFNWRFTNVGDLPPGATEPLPRDFKPYITN